MSSCRLTYIRECILYLCTRAGMGGSLRDVYGRALEALRHSLQCRVSRAVTRAEEHRAQSSCGSQPAAAATFLDIVEGANPCSPVDIWLICVIRGLSPAMRARWCASVSIDDASILTWSCLRVCMCARARVCVCAHTFALTDLA